MKKITWLSFYLIVVVVELVAIQLNNLQLQNIFKPLLMPVLILFLSFDLKGKSTSIKTWVLLALIFSWAGDVLLMFQEKNADYFLFGLVCFLLAHICYIIFFHQVRVIEKIKGNPWLLLIVVLYYAGLIVLLNPYLGEMKLPVRIYGIVISFMFMLAMHMGYLKNKLAGNYMIIGALLFVVSDSILAINKFYRPFEPAGLLIMLTYGAAQLLIVLGAMNYIRTRENVVAS